MNGYTQETTPQISTVQVTAKQSICIACAEGDHDESGSMSSALALATGFLTPVAR